MGQFRFPSRAFRAVQRLLTGSPRPLAAHDGQGHGPRAAGAAFAAPVGAEVTVTMVAGEIEASGGVTAGADGNVHIADFGTTLRQAGGEMPGGGGSHFGWTNDRFHVAGLPAYPRARLHQCCARWLGERTGGGCLGCGQSLEPGQLPVDGRPHRPVRTRSRHGHWSRPERTDRRGGSDPQPSRRVRRRSPSLRRRRCTGSRCHA